MVAPQTISRNMGGKKRRPRQYGGRLARPRERIIKAEARKPRPGLRVLEKPQ